MISIQFMIAVKYFHLDSKGFGLRHPTNREQLTETTVTIDTTTVIDTVIENNVKQTQSFLISKKLENISSNNNDTFQIGNSNSNSLVQTVKGSQRIAVIVLYIGGSLPNWFESFALTASSSEDICDWLIFTTTETPVVYTSSNVKIIQLTEEEIYQRLSSMDRNYANGEEEFDIPGAFAELLRVFSYSLVEFKPALGYIFKDYLSSYSHWAYADLDELIGSIDRFVSRDHLDMFDIITFTFGDTYRLYMRGQFTILRNSKITTDLWQHCTHLSKVGARLERFMSSIKSGKRSWRFQSAEGCFSKVVATARNVSVLFIANQVTDAVGAAVNRKEMIWTGDSVLRCYENPLTLPMDR